MSQAIANQSVLKRLSFSVEKIAELKKEIERDFDNNATRYYIAGYVRSDGSEIDEPENYGVFDCDCCGEATKYAKVYEVEHESGLDGDIQYLNLCKVCAVDLWAYIPYFDE